MPYPATEPRRWIVLGLLRAALIALLGVALPAAATDYRFRRLPDAAGPTVSATVLSDEERAFIAALPELRVAVPQPAAEPYERIGPDGEVSGIHPDMLLALARTFGLRLKPVVLPSWSAVLEAARRHEVDIVMTLGVTQERMDYLAFTLGATPLPGALFARKGTRPDPAQARYALESNFLAQDWVRRQYPQATIVTVETTGDALRAVGEGRADLYLGSLLEAGAWLARQPVPGVEMSGLLSYGTGYYHFGVRKDWAMLAGILNKGIQTLRTTTSAELASALGGLPAGTRVSHLLSTSGEEAAYLAGKPVWRVGAVRGLALLNEVDARGLHSGIAAEYTEEVARRLGVAVQLIAYDSVAALLDGLRAGEIDLVPFITPTPERQLQFDYSTAYVEMPYVLVARTDAPMYWGLDSLRGKRLALAPQHPLRPIVAARYPDIRVVDAPPGTGAMEMVVNGQAEAAVDVRLYANLFINSQSAETLRAVTEVRELPTQFHFAALKPAPELIELVNRALADIGPEERQRMLRRWIAIDLQPAFQWRRYAPLIAVTLAALLVIAGLTAWWVARMKREVRARRRSEELLQDIATTIPGMAFRYVLNADGSMRHHFFTPGARAFLGIDLDAKRTVVASMEPYLKPEEFERAKAMQLHSARTGERFKVTFAYSHPDGRERWLAAEAVQTTSRNGRTVWTGYLVDVSTEHELQERLRRDAESRSLMLASASHELRAPTHTLSLALQALSGEHFSDDDSLALQRARQSAHTLAELLNDVLDAARDGHETMRLRPRAFDLHTLLEDLAGAWRAAAATKGLAFDLQRAADLPRTITLDPLRLKQVLINLLSNACKYTDAGMVGLSAGLDAQGRLRFVVSDTGIGIAPEEQARLFEPFVTLPTARGKGDGDAAHVSTGLGLSVSRRVTQLLGGELSLQSAPGQGTRVTLTLPVTPGRSAQAAGPAGSAAEGGGTVVVCDDDETSRVLMAHMLRRQGFRVSEADDAGATLQQWRSGGVRALVTDLDLPGMSGLELIRALRAEETAGAARTPVIVCSGSSVPEADGAPDDALYDAYLVKPVAMLTLVDTLRRLGVAA